MNYFKPFSIFLWFYIILFLFVFSAFHTFFFTFYSGSPYESTVFIMQDGSTPTTFDILFSDIYYPIEYMHFGIVAALMCTIVHYFTKIIFRNRLANSLIISMQWTAFLSTSTISYLFILSKLPFRLIHPNFNEFMKLALLFPILCFIILLPFVGIFYSKIVQPNENKEIKS